MYGGQGNQGNNMQERITDNWIQQNVPGGLNSPLGEQLDNAMGGNPNPTYGQVVGGAPGVGGFGNQGYPGGGGFGNQGYPGGAGFGNQGSGYPGQYGGNEHHHHHHH